MNMKRMRGRNHRGAGGGGGGGGGGGIRHHGGNIPMNRNHVFDSQGPESRKRGTAQQLFEYYLQCGRDATSTGDRVAAEGFFQHAEHYFRIMSAMQAVQQQAPNGQNNGGSNGQYRRPMNGGDGTELGDDFAPGLGDQPMQDPRDVAQDLAREGARESVREGVREGTRDSARDGSRDGPRDGARERTRDSARDVVRDGARDIARDGSRDIPIAAAPPEE